MGELASLNPESNEADVNTAKAALTKCADTLDAATTNVTQVRDCLKGVLVAFVSAATLDELDRNCATPVLEQFEGVVGKFTATKITVPF